MASDRWRVFLDTNVLVSGVLSSTGASAAILDLGEAEEKVRQLAADLAKAETPHQHRVKAAAAGDQAQRGSVQTEQQITDYRCPEQGREVEGHADLAAGEHRGGEEGEAEQQNGRRQQPFTSVTGHFTQGVVAVLLGLVHVHRSRWGKNLVIAGRVPTQAGG